MSYHTPSVAGYILLNFVFFVIQIKLQNQMNFNPVMKEATLMKEIYEQYLEWVNSHPVIHIIDWIGRGKLFWDIVVSIYNLLF